MVSNMLCPKCRLPLTKLDRTYKCSNNHSYDISKYGYVNLLLSKTNCGDLQASTHARVNFLSGGYYDDLVEALDNVFRYHNLHSLLDCGCGVGYYSGKLSSKYSITGIDISKDAITIASKKDKISSYIVCSSSDIPIETSSFDGAYVIFAPLFWKSMESLIKNNGILTVVTPGAKHLYELKEFLYDNPYLNEQTNLSNEAFTLIEEKHLTYTKDIKSNDLLNLVAMTPYMFKTKKERIDKLNKIDSLNITIDFIITTFRKNI